MAQRKALGRGLSALLGTAVIQAPPETARVEVEGEQLREIDIDRILPNTQQPRKIFEESALNELADSIRAHGVIQPVVVQPLPDNFYELIAGERRWRAAQKAGLHKLPALVRETGPNASLEIALIENLQREDLNPIEEAQAYQRLISEFGLTQEEVAKRVGKSRVTVANMVRLLRLPPEVQQWMSEQKLTTGHAKALLSLLSPDAILLAARKMIQGNYSVRQAELFVARFGKKDSGNQNDSPNAVDPNVTAAIRSLEQALGTKVSIEENGGKGRIELHFFSMEEMHRLYDGLMRVRF
jgi:ParB family transcriptional regulator, chromosome partitioning protein